MPPEQAIIFRHLAFDSVGAGTPHVRAPPRGTSARACTPTRDLSACGEAHTDARLPGPAIDQSTHVHMRRGDAVRVTSPSACALLATAAHGVEPAVEQLLVHQRMRQLAQVFFDERGDGGDALRLDFAPPPALCTGMQVQCGSVPQMTRQVLGLVLDYV